MSSSSVVIRGRIRRFKLGNRSLSTIIVHWQQSPYVARAVTLHRVWRGQRSNRDNNRNSLDLSQCGRRGQIGSGVTQRSLTHHHHRVPRSGTAHRISREHLFAVSFVCVFSFFLSWSPYSIQTETNRYRLAGVIIARRSVLYESYLMYESYLSFLIISHSHAINWSALWTFFIPPFLVTVKLLINVGSQINAGLF